VVTRSVWLEELLAHLVADVGEDSAETLLARYADALSDVFIGCHSPGQTTALIAALEDSGAVSEPTLNLLAPSVRARALDDEALRLVLLWSSPPPALLADVFPVMENLGVRVAGHDRFVFRPAGRAAVQVEEFGMPPRDAALLSDGGRRELVTDAFGAVWSGAAEDDGFNQLVFRMGLSWREVAVLRAGFSYLRQAGTAFSQAYTQRTLLTQGGITRLLVELFHARFDPAQRLDGREQEARTRVETALTEIDNLTDDRLLRALLAFVTSTVRTNYYQRDARGQVKPYLVFKLDPDGLPFLPRPRPMLETFVYSPRVEGLHLRAARVARGGLRWSDRTEDYRTEVLGLMRSQRVKNAIIVPHGAKGAFVLKRPPAATNVEALREEVRHCYSTFIRGLLDITDNQRDGVLMPPPDVVCHDDPDPYLVVAADKGTATFSDLANSIAAEYGFWLGDAFASGGSSGYDHKALAVTARGAWESLRRHFAEMGIDPGREMFTVVGIGDMSGDVFGNTMLLSDRIRLVAAFDHRHIFIDPDPDPAASYAERRRLFSLPGSSWADYRQELISMGGGVYPRTAKSVPLSPEARALLGLKAERIPGDELIRTMLQAPVDVLFNGGIGTYVKASGEAHAEAGDPANDGVRVDANTLRARVVVEGGNLGLTQHARIEYALAGGRINTDFIDNSAGVDTSDREVNIKILLDAAVDAGWLTRDRRNQLLKDVAGQVVDQLLANNAAQAQAISVSHALGVRWLDHHVQAIRFAEEGGYVDWPEEFMPDAETIARRQEAGIGLTRPEIAVLLAISKNALARLLLGSEVPDDPYAGRGALDRYLPPGLREEFSDLVHDHPLRREIAATVLANERINRTGSGLLLRVRELTGQSGEQAMFGYVASRDVLGLQALWAEIDRLDMASHADLQTQMLIEIRSVLSRTVRWFLRHRHTVDPAAEVALLRPGVDKLTGCLREILSPAARTDLQERVARMVSSGAPAELAHSICALRPVSLSLDIIESSAVTGADLPRLAAVQFVVGAQFGLDWLRAQAADLGTDDHWTILAKTSLRDEISTQQQRLAIAILRDAEAGLSPADATNEWLERNDRLHAVYRQTLDRIRQTHTVDLAKLSVAVEGLRTLVYVSHKHMPGGGDGGP
jgi:glutamate dehydrogenase